MTFKRDGENWLIVLKKGENLIASLTEFAVKENIKSAWVSGLGGAIFTELGFYDLENKQYVFQKFDELMEVTSLQGNLAWVEDRPVFHIHATLTKADFSAIGGHLKELVVGGTCEMFLHKWNDQIGLTRQKDNNTGLNLLNV